MDSGQQQLRLRSKPNTPVRCQICRDRKIKCDGTLPQCHNCQRANRKCRPGDRFPLSWPAAHSRRAMHGVQGRGHYVVPARRQIDGGYYFIHVPSSFVEAHAMLSRAQVPVFGRGHTLSDEHALLGRGWTKQPSSVYGDVERLQAGGANLMSYFYHEAASSLPQIDSAPEQFRDLLLRMSLHDDSPSSRALLYALFCLSALRRHGNPSESAHFKGLALRMLQRASDSASGLTREQTMQHVATGLLLCRAEVALGDDATVFWGLYVCNLRALFEAAFAWRGRAGTHVGTRDEAADARLLYRYVLYHEVLSKFSLDHWRRPPSALHEQLVIPFRGDVLRFPCSGQFDLDADLGADLGADLDRFMHCEMLLLSRIVDAAHIEHHAPDQRFDDGHRQRVDRLAAAVERALRQSQQACGKSPGCPMDVQRYLFLAASWIYFQRTCRGLVGPSAAITALLNDVLSRTGDVARLGVRVMPFSLFLVGSEAADEERRRQVLELVRVGLRSAISVRRHAAPERYEAAEDTTECLLAAVWTQDDLQAVSQEGHLDYVTKMQWAITTRTVLPALV